MLYLAKVFIPVYAPQQSYLFFIIASVKLFFITCLSLYVISQTTSSLKKERTESHFDFISDPVLI